MNRDTNNVIVSPNVGVSTDGPPDKVADPEVGLPLADDDIAVDPVQSAPPQIVDLEQEPRTDDNGSAEGKETGGSKLTPTTPGCAYRHKLDDLITWVEVERQKHLLAFAHFRALNFYVLFLPMTFITLTSGILSVYATKIDSSGTDDCTQEADEIADLQMNLVFVAGILSFFTTFFNALQEKLRYASRTDMHESAALQLKNMRFTLDALMVDAELEAMSAEVKMERMKELEALRDSFLKIMDSCMSIIPTRINEPINLMRARIAALYQSSNSMRDLYGAEVKVHRLAAIEVGSVICSFKWYFLPFFPFCFPLTLPSPEYSCTMTMKSLKESVLDGNALHDA
jgi:hypothetical protein